MKKKNFKLIIAVVMLVCVSMLTLVGCSTKLKIDDIYDIASYRVATANKTVTIEVKSGDTLVYSYKDGQNNDYFDIGFSNADFSASGSGLNFAKGMLTKEVISNTKKEASYSADIADPTLFLGDADATDGKVEAVCIIKPKSLKSLNITYNTTKNGTVYSVAIAVA